MHEMSIALEVIKIAEERVGEKALPDVVKVGVQVGNDAGVVIDSLQFCLEVVLAAAPFGRAKPEIECVEGDVLRLSYLEVDDGSAAD